jgi:hypothetical protein
MRKPLLIGAACCVALGVLAAAQEKPLNLIQNAGLEEALDAKTGLPKDWYRFQRPVNAYKMEVLADEMGAGNVVRVQGEGDYGGVVANKLPLDPAKVYAARAWVRAEGASTARVFIKLDFFDEKGAYLKSSKSNISVKPGAPGWQVVSLVERGWDYPEAKQVAAVCGVNGQATAWFDNVELVLRDGRKEELLPDGGMETVAGESHLRWTIHQAKDGKAQRLRRQVPVKDGWYSIQLRGAAQWAITESPHVNLEPGKKYTFSGWARARKGKAQIKIGYFGPDGYLGQTVSPDVTANEWQMRAVVAEPEKFPGATRISVAGVGNGPEIEVFFDAFSLIAE